VLNFAVATIAERTNALKTANQKLKKLSRMDGLTGIANRRLFDDSLRNEWRRAVRHKTDLSLILLDVDHFKQYNDMYGHQQGDRCLVAVAGAIGNQVTRPADLVARYGGEEFAVILPNTDAEGALQVAEKIRRAVFDLKVSHEGSETSSFVTLSLGVDSTQPKAEDKISAFVERTDQALYQAKRTGRNKVMVSA
jgi:diguanylate cyclase (GGDEF)-like protein